MDEESIAKAADQLLGGYASRVPVAPLAAAYPGLSTDDAYAIQFAQVTAWTAAGARVKGHKVGLTSAAMQRQFGVEQPDFGHLLDTIADNASSGAVLGSPVNALVWLANTLGPLGVTLEAGHVVLPGSVCAAIPFGPGDTVSATFDRIGSVSITFSAKPSQ